MEKDDLDGSEEHHLRRLIATIEPRLQRRLLHAEMRGKLLCATEDEAGAMQ